MTPRRTLRRPPLLAGLALALVGTAACSPQAEPQAAPPETPASGQQEVSSATPRLVTTFDGGALVLDAATLEVLAEVPLEGFSRVNPAGDGRHVLVSTAGGFRVLDTGTWTQAHGDHGHHYTAPPRLTDTTFTATEPGHVVSHADRTVLFDDGTGTVQSFDPHELAEGRPQVDTWTAPEAHHGVAVERSDGSMVVTVGDAESRQGVAVLDEDGEELASSDDCPGVHGEAVTAGERVVLGCEDGVLVVDDERITKLASPDDYGRIGNQAGSEESPYLLGDYKSDPDAELERPERVAAVDTAEGELQLVDLGTSYSFRSLARGPHGEGLVLGTDGALHEIDLAEGEVTGSVPVVEPWEEPLEWQQPRPTVFVLDHTAYVTEPATSELHAVDLETGEVTATGTLPHVPNELTGVTG
ncbi:zinc metallochaperone AztD [Auraticoccus cholistanensis]|nr:zinc metallochaperone AztD [Auraticoccus cholistanensis]